MSNIIILFFLLPLFLIGFLFWRPVRNLAAGKAGILKNRGIVKVLLTTYALLLILAPFIYGLLPKEGTEFPRVHEKSLAQNTMKLEQAIYDGRLDEINPEYIREEWQQKYNGKKLKLQQAEEEPVPVVVERKPDNDGVIEGKYIASVIYQGMDFSDKVKTILFDLSNDTLKLEEVGDYFEFTGVISERDFALSQFTESRNIFGEGRIRQVRYIYLRIPKDLQIQEKDELYFNYTGEVQVD